MKQPITIIVVGLLIAGGWFAWTHEDAPAPGWQVFETEFPHWFIERARGAVDDDTPLAASLAAWPDVREAVHDLDAAFPDARRVKAEAPGVNAALEAAGLPYWIDVHVYGETPIVLTYEVVGSDTWTSGEHTVRPLRVQRLDKTNVVTGFLGHAGAERPLVLLDRIETMLLEELRAIAGQGAGNEIDEAMRALWRAHIAKPEPPAHLDELAKRLAARDRIVDGMETRLKGQPVLMRAPNRLHLGDAYLDVLRPLAESQGGRPPLLLGPDVRNLKEADRALHDDDVQAAFDRALELEAAAVEAHEVRHAVVGEEAAPPPQSLIDLAGDDDMRFLASANDELLAYLGELHDMAPHPCLGLLRLARSWSGANARSTPHHYAAQALLIALGPKPIEEAAELIANVKALCELDDQDLRAKVATAHRELYGEELVPARRSVPGGR